MVDKVCSPIYNYDEFLSFVKKAGNMYPLAFFLISFERG
jgi:hypothetical protein